MAKEVHSNFVRGVDKHNDKKNRSVSADTASKENVSSSASIFRELTGLPVEVTSSAALQANVTGKESYKSLPEANIGFKLLKKSGWKEGSGLGLSEQGRLNPLEAEYKSDRSGIGAKNKLKRRSREPAREESPVEDDGKASSKEKRLSKKSRKLEAEEERMRERAFEQQFYREFWPENV